MFKHTIGVLALLSVLLSPLATAHSSFSREVVKGTIEKIDLENKVMVVDKRLGGSVELSFSANTNFYYEGDPVNMTHFKVGDKVRIERRFYKTELQASR